MRLIQQGSLIVDFLQHIVYLLVGTVSVPVFERPVGDRSVYFQEGSETIVEILHFGCVSVVQEPKISLFQQFLQFVELFLCTECFQARTLKFLLKYLESLQEVSSYARLLLNIRSISLLGISENIFLLGDSRSIFLLAICQNRKCENYQQKDKSHIFGNIIFQLHTPNIIDLDILINYYQNQSWIIIRLPFNTSPHSLYLGSTSRLKKLEQDRLVGLGFVIFLRIDPLSSPSLKKLLLGYQSSIGFERVILRGMYFRTGKPVTGGQFLSRRDVYQRGLKSSFLVVTAFLCFLIPMLLQNLEAGRSLLVFLNQVPLRLQMISFDLSSETFCQPTMTTFKKSSSCMRSNLARDKLTFYSDCIWGVMRVEMVLEILGGRDCWRMRLVKALLGLTSVFLGLCGCCQDLDGD